MTAECSALNFCRPSLFSRDWPFQACQYVSGTLRSLLPEQVLRLVSIRVRHIAVSFTWAGIEVEIQLLVEWVPGTEKFSYDSAFSPLLWFVYHYSLGHFMSPPPPQTQFTVWYRYELWNNTWNNTLHIQRNVVLLTSGLKWSLVATAHTEITTSHFSPFTSPPPTSQPHPYKHTNHHHYHPAS